MAMNIICRECFVVDSLHELQTDLNNKIQSMSNWVDILDRVSIETTYGLLLADRGKNTNDVWQQLLKDLDEVRKISGKINNHPIVSGPAPTFTEG